MTSVLVVDDSALDRKLAGGLLEKRLEIAVLYANDGRDALKQFEHHVPDLVVTDLMMPEMNGLELVEAVRHRYPLTPVVMMTSKGSEEIAVEALEKGAASYVPKRILSRRLPETVERILEVAREVKEQARLMERLVADECVFLLENDIRLIASFVRYLRQGLRGVGLCEESDHMRISIAVEEALLNAYYHGNLEVDSKLREGDGNEFMELARQRCDELPYRDRRISIKATYSDSEAVFVIRDDGEGFDSRQIPDPTNPDNLLRSTGRGLLLMRSFMDELRFNDIGNEVTMIKRRKVKKVRQGKTDSSARLTSRSTSLQDSGG